MEWFENNFGNKIPQEFVSSFHAWWSKRPAENNNDDIEYYVLLAFFYCAAAKIETSLNALRKSAHEKTML